MKKDKDKTTEPQTVKTTSFLDEVYKQVRFDRDLVFKFFTVFSLFEHALKNAGFVTPANKHNDAQPNWDKFAVDIEGEFNPKATPELEAAVTYMLAKPVMRQVVKETQLEFFERSKPENQKEIVWISVLVRGVRNNLFHGAKFRYDPDRDSELIRYSLVILEAWAHCNKDVERDLQHAH